MAWYKKQLAEILKKTSTSDVAASLGKQSPKGSRGYVARSPAKKGTKNNYPNPVSNQNRNRSKTDLP